MVVVFYSFSRSIRIYMKTLGKEREETHAHKQSRKGNEYTNDDYSNGSEEKKNGGKTGRNE